MPREAFGEDFRFMDRAEILSFEEILRLARVFTGLGVYKVRLTGGEPLMRRELPSLVAQLVQVPGLLETALTTNGSLLAELAEPLREAGLGRLTVSLDSIDADRFMASTDSRVPLERVLRGLQAVKAAGFPDTKLNCVLRRGFNEADILPLAGYAREQGFTLRFIEFMDVGTRNGWRLDTVVPAAEVAEVLASRWPIERIHKPGPDCVAQHWRYLDGGGEVGLIASVTEPFCTGCDRARLSADGHLFTCLFASSGLDLKRFLRSGATDEELAAVVEARWRRRDDRYSELRTEATADLPRAEMHKLGG
jgi:cyclic pyranopterin phosphate synthase